MSNCDSSRSIGIAAPRHVESKQTHLTVVIRVSKGNDENGGKILQLPTTPCELCNIYAMLVAAHDLHKLSCVLSRFANVKALPL